METETDTQTTKDVIVLTLRLCGWERLFELWYRCYAPGLPDDIVHRAVDGYVNLLADDVAGAVVNNFIRDGVMPPPDALFGDGDG